MFYICNDEIILFYAHKIYNINAYYYDGFKIFYNCEISLKTINKDCIGIMT